MVSSRGFSTPQVSSGELLAHSIWDHAREWQVEVAGSLKLGGAPLHAVTWTAMLAFLEARERLLVREIFGIYSMLWLIR